MPIAIHLRNDIDQCIYRDAIIESISGGFGDEVLLCSGFFQENFQGSPYQATAEPGFISGLVSNKIKIETFGIHNSHWLPSYRNFCRNLRTNGVNVQAWIQKGFKWHAKVFILKENGKPVFGIIGSSNITANAFGVRSKPAHPSDSPNPPRQFNYETDVFLWEDSNSKVNATLSNILLPPKSKKDLNGSIRARYLAEDNENVSITDRLMNLEEQVRTAGTNVELEF